MRAKHTPLFLRILLAAGMAATLSAAPLKNEAPKKPCQAPPPTSKTQVAPAPTANPTVREMLEPGFGRKFLDLSLQAKAKTKAASQS